MYSLAEFQSMASKSFSTYASMVATMMLIRSVAYDIIPAPVKTFLQHLFKYFMDKYFSQPRRSTYVTIVVDEYSGNEHNEIFDAAQTYLSTKFDPDAERFKVSKNSKHKVITLTMVKDQQVCDSFKGFDVRWKLFVLVDKADRDDAKRYLELTCKKSNKQTVVDEYLPFVLAQAKGIKLYTRNSRNVHNHQYQGGWGHVKLDHPITFDKLAMDKIPKRAIIDDLDMFLRRKDFYKRVGKAWKRGYLLYGPPGTGKSSLVAAMANYLKFDIYDLELTSVHSNTELKNILHYTTNRSILVIEDIDCTVQSHSRINENNNLDDSCKLTLSGLLNFIDGLWSACGDERIIVFTTNYKEKLDSALLRPGRMDMHIHMGYCTPEGFDVFALTYLEIDHHELFPVIKELICEVEISPAEIAEHLMRSEDVDVALQGLVNLLKEKKN